MSEFEDDGVIEEEIPSPFESDDAPPPQELSPRHRRLALLAAEGHAPGKICEELGYSSSRVSVLLASPLIKAEIARIQDRIFEETISGRMKSMVDPALNVIQSVLTDRTGRVKIREKTEVAMWLIEKIDGKAVQKLEAGTGLLAQLMDRLDRSKPQLTQVNITNNFADAPSAPKDVSPPQLDSPDKASEEDLLDVFFTEMDQKG